MHYLLCGTFNTIFLYLLAFSPYSANSNSDQASSLRVHRRVRGQGPHQYIALDHDRKTAYATTWAQPPTLSSWQVLEHGRAGLRHVNTVPICAYFFRTGRNAGSVAPALITQALATAATGSYLTVSPPSLPFPPRIYQAGGPVAQAFAVDEETGGYGELMQEVIYLAGGQRELDDPKTDKTRVALRYGSHAVDIDPVRKRAYIPHV